MTSQAWHDVGLLARADGSPVRLRSNGRRRLRATGLYFSGKSGRHLPYESQLELQDLWNAEVDVEVVASQVQSFTLRYIQAGVLHRYTPARLDHLACGRRRVVEIKDRPNRLCDEVARNVAQLLAERGLAYEVRHAAEIAREPAFSAVRAIQARRRTSVSVDAVLRVQALLRGDPRPVTEVLGSSPPARAASRS